MSIHESLRREKFCFGRFAKVYVREMQNFLAREVSARKVYTKRKNETNKQARAEKIRKVTQELKQIETDKGYQTFGT